MTKTVLDIEKIYAALIENDMHYEIYKTGEDTFDVIVEWGDWKHDHLALEWFLGEKFGTECRQETVTEQDGSDTYSSIHHFKLNEDTITLDALCKL